MSIDLVEQIEDYFGQVEAQQQPVSTEEVEARLGSVSATRPPSGLSRSGPLVAAAAAVLVLLAGGIPLLFAGEETPTAGTLDSTPASTIATTQTSSPTVSDSSPSTDGNQEVLPAVAPLTFAEIALPRSEVSPTPWTTASFNDALYVMTQTGQLWALTDGESWEFVKDLTELDGPPVEFIESGEDMLVLFARDQGVTRGGEECMAAGHQLYVHVMRVDGSWTSTQVPQPFSGESECQILELADPVVGRPGILITGAVDGPSGSDRQSVGWWSPDGIDWQQMDTTIPDQHGGIQGAVATQDGFIVVTDGDDETPRVTLTTEDGQSWTAIESASRHDDGQIYEFNGEILLGDGRDFFTGQPRVPAEIFYGRTAWGPHVHFGGLGIVGTPSFSSLPLGGGGPNFAGREVETFVYSPDGVSFVEWKPTEFDYLTASAAETLSEDGNGTVGLVRVLGITDDFVLVVHEREANGEMVQTLWMGTPSG